MLDTTLKDAVGFAGMTVPVLGVAWWIEPRARRPWPQLVAAAVAVFVVVTVVDELDLIRNLHDHVVNRIGGEFDEAATWMVALAGAVVAAAVGDLVLRAVRRRRGGPSASTE